MVIVLMKDIAMRKFMYQLLSGKDVGIAFILIQGMSIRSSPKNLRVEEMELIIFFNPMVMKAL